MTEVTLLIGSGWQPYREYLLRGLAERSRLWLIDDQPVTWQQPYLHGSTEIAGDDVPGRDGRFAAAAVAVAAHQRVTGVVTYDELLVTTAASLAERLGVPGLSAAGAQNCRDKARTRARLTDAGLRQPRFALVHDLPAALAAAATIGYPVVAKPRGMGASVGVVLATGPELLAAAFGVADRVRSAGPQDFAAGVLIEELLTGPEISIDAAVVDGAYHPFCLARKQLGEPPYFEEVGHLVDAADPLLTDPELLSYLAAAHRALGVHTGVTHTEVRLTAAGPAIVEVNARLGGDLIPYLGKLATGLDPGQIAADAARGIEPVLRPSLRRCAGIRFAYPAVDCRVLAATAPEVADVPGLVESRVIVQPGSVLRLPPRAHLGRYAYLIGVADTPASCREILDQAAGKVSLEFEPLADAETFVGRPW